jgi:Ca2+/Na+ antiporter
MLPETLFLFRYLPKGISFVYIVEWYGLLISLLWLIFGRFLQKHHTMEHLLKLGIYTFIALYFVVMFRVPILVIIAFCIGAGIFLFHQHYYRSEYLIDSKALEPRPED